MNAPCPTAACQARGRLRRPRPSTASSAVPLNGLPRAARRLLGCADRARPVDRPARPDIRGLLRRRPPARAGADLLDHARGEHRRRIDRRRDRARLPRRPCGACGGSDRRRSARLRWHCGSGPRIRRVAAEHDLRTVGDFLEWRYGVPVRTAIAALLWVGAVFILAGQLIGDRLDPATRWSASRLRPAAPSAALLITIYFTAGGPADVGVGERRAADGEAGRIRGRAAAGAGGCRRVGRACARCSRRPTSGTRGRAASSG